MKPVGLYVRASTGRQQETVDAQSKILKTFAAENNLNYVLYIDEDVSGQKASREAYDRLLADVEKGKIGKIYFTKLDRWFRNLAEYSNTNEFLKKHNVKWSAVLEPQFSTDNAMSEAITNIVMAIAQLEAKQIGERIDVVFQNKIDKGETIFGNQNLPFGYKVDDKAVVKDAEVAHIVEEMFDLFEHTCHSVRGTKLFIEAKYDLSFSYNSFKKIFSNTLYYGAYRSNQNFIKDPYISYERWVNIQRLLKLNVKKRSTNRAYIFSGLIVCESCGSPMAGQYVKQNGKEYYHYRCNQHRVQGRCNNNKCVSELLVEKYVLKNIGRILESKINKIRADVTDVEIQKMVDNEAKIRKKQAKLNDLYVNDFITLEEYKQKHAELETLIVKAPINEKKDLDAIKALLEGDYLDAYESLSREEKRVLWRGVIGSIEASDGVVTDINFS